MVEIPSIDLIKMFISLVFIPLSYNLLKLKNWSRVLLLILNTLTALIISVVNLLLLLVLHREKAVELFREMYPHFTTVAFMVFNGSYLFLRFSYFLHLPQSKGAV